MKNVMLGRKREAQFGLDPQISIDSSLEAKWWLAFMLQNYGGAERFRNLRDEVEQQIHQVAQSFPEPGPRRHVETIEAGITPEEFRERYYGTDTPVLIKGFYKDTRACRTWTPELFKQRYADEIVPSRINATTTTDYRTADLTMAELVDDMLNDGEFHGTGFEAVLNHNPELREDLDVPRLEPYAIPPSRKKAPLGLHRVMGRVFSTQMFMAAPRATTGWHCAGPTNLFAMIYGKKHWTLVHPRYTPFMHTVIRKDRFYFLSLLDHRISDDEVKSQGYQLYPHIPKCEAIVDAGDMLFVPSWWWHAVDNYGPTIAVAPRATGEPLRNNPLFTLMTMFDKSQWVGMWIVLRDKWPDDRFIGRSMKGWGLPERVAVPRRSRNKSSGSMGAQAQV